MPAYADSHNAGVGNGSERQVTSMKMHVDDNLMTDVMPHIEYAIVASIDSIFQVLGTPEPQLRKTALSEDKFVKTALSSLRNQLGVTIDTRQLTISVTEEKRKSLHTLLETLVPHRKGFTLKDIATLTGTLTYLSVCSSWAGFCFTWLQETLNHSYKVLYAKLRKDPKFAKLNSSPPPGHFSVLRLLENELIVTVW